MITTVSRSSFDKTVERLRAAIGARGLTVFAEFDHAAAAAEAELELDGELVVVFGNPRAGTPLMQDDPRIGIELPLKILVWESDGVVSLGEEDYFSVRKLEAAGIPVLSIDADNVDRRTWSEEQLSEAIGKFIEERARPAAERRMNGK